MTQSAAEAQVEAGPTRRVLVAEDEALIRLDLVEMQDAGQGRTAPARYLLDRPPSSPSHGRAAGARVRWWP